MSRNLVKQFFTTAAEEKRVIDVDEVLRRRENADALLKSSRQPDSDGFLPGLDAEEVDVSSEEADSVIKAKEEAQALIEEAKEEAQVLLEKAQADAQTIVENARREASNIYESTIAQAEAEKKNVLEQARKQGYDAGQAKVNAEAEAAKHKFDEKARQLEAEYQQQLDELEPQFVDTITSIYEHIFHVELESHQEILEHLISDAMHRLEGNHNFLIHVSKEDYPYVCEQKPRILSGAVSAGDTVDVVEDMTLKKNECLIETDSGILDCGLGTQMEELKRKLMLLAWSRED